MASGQSRSSEVIMVVEPGASGAAWMRLAGECAAQLDAASTVVLGTGPDARMAAAGGLRVVDACAPLLASPLLGWRTLIRALAPHLRGRTVVAWSPFAAAVAARLAPRVVVASPCAPAQPQVAKTLAHAARGRAAVDVIPFHAMAAVGWPRSNHWRVHAPLAALPNVGASVDRVALRRRWGVDDQTFAVGLIGSPVAAGHAHRALDMLVRAALTGPRLALVLHPSACQARGALQWAAAAPGLVHVAVEAGLSESWQVAAGLDAALCVDAWREPTVGRGALVLAAAALTSGAVEPSVPGGSIDALLLARCGVPVVATLQSTASEFAGAWPDLVVDERRPNAVARALIQIARSDRAAHADQRAAAAALPGSAELVARIRQLMTPQRAAA